MTAYEKIFSPDPRDVVEGLLELAERGDRRTGQIASDLMDHPDPRVRIAALEALGMTDLVPWVDEIIEALHDPDPDVRRTAEYVIRDFIVGEGGKR